jgi:hypothetical protein
MTTTNPIKVGSVLRLAGAKSTVTVVEHDGDNYTVRGLRGEFLLTDCGAHWVRWPHIGGAFRNASPRECKIEVVS